MTIQEKPENNKVDTNTLNWWVYMLQCADNTIYTGVTTDVVRRLYEHNHTDKGAKYTKVRRPVHLAWLVQADNRSAAQQREYALKKLSRVRKQQLITKDSEQTQCHAQSLDWGCE